MKNLSNLNVKEISFQDSAEITGGGFWEGVGYVIGYHVGLYERFTDGFTEGADAYTPSCD